VLVDIGICAQGAKERIKIAGESVLDRVETASARELKRAAVGAANADVLHDVFGTAMFFEQVRAALK
jgi:hypothetical protein